MKRTLQGHSLKFGAGDEAFNAFVPALLALGRLDAVTDLLPNAGLLLYSFVRKEAVLSSMIEGTQSSLADLMLFELDEQPGVPVEDAREVNGIARPRRSTMSGLALRK